MPGKPGEISQATLYGQPVEQAFTPEEQDLLAQLNGFDLQQVAEMGDGHKARLFREAAEKEFDLGGDDAFVTKSLDAAIAVTDASEELGSSLRIKEYEVIAVSAYITEKPEAYVRDILDKALSVIDGDMKALPSRSFHTARLRTLANVAHKTQQASGYIEHVFDSIRKETLARDYADSQDLLWSAGELVKEGQGYGLGDRYILGILNEARAAARKFPETSQQVRALGGLGMLAYRKLKDPEYTQDIICEAELSVMEGISDLSEKIGVLSPLARIAHTTEQPEELTISPLLLAGMEALFNFQEGSSHEERVQVAHDMSDVARTIADVGGSDIIEDVVADNIDVVALASVSERERHMLLNAALRGIDLKVEFLEEHGVEKKPLSYVFMHDVELSAPTRIKITRPERTEA